MKQESRSLIAVALSVAVFIIWYSFFSPKPVEKGQQQPAAVGTTTQAATQQAAGEKTTGDSPKTIDQGQETSDVQANIPIQTNVLETDLYKITFTNDGGIPASWEMKKFVANGTKEKKETPVNIVSSTLAAYGEKVPFVGIPDRPRYKLAELDAGKIVYLWSSKDWDIRKIYKLNKENYLVDLTIGITNKGASPVMGSLVVFEQQMVPKEEKRGMLGFLKGPENIFQPVYYVNGKVNRAFEKINDGNLLWAGIEDRYFINALIPKGLGGSVPWLETEQTLNPDGTRVLKASIKTPEMSFLPRTESVMNLNIYGGPKEMENLKMAAVSLDKAIDYGWFSVIAIPILYILKFLYSVIHNYGVAIILLTIFVKLLLNPLSKHSMKSMKAMQQLQPRLKELKEKYKGDKERLNVETMQLFKANKVNPMGGCLPMLLQMPIYIALYKVLWNSIELYRAPFFWFYKDLSAPDPTFIMPVLMGVAMWLQQKMTPSVTADPTQAKMMQIMPIMFTAFMLFLPAGLVLYIFVNTIMGVAQQWMMNKDLRLRDVLRGQFSRTSA